MRSRTFLLGVTAAHGSLEPIVLVRNQEEEHNRRLRQPAVGNGLQNRERWVRPPQPPLSGSILRFDFFLYTRHDSCTGHTGNQASPKPRKRCHRPCSSADRATASGAVGRGFEPRQGHCGMPGEPPASRPAAIAQTAERTPRKRQVAGSCPARGSNGSRAPSGAGPSLPLAPSRTASLSLTAGPTFAGMGRAIRFSSGPSPSGRAPRSQRGGRGFESRRLHHAQNANVRNT